jgi:hypothetical protein
MKCGNPYDKCFIIKKPPRFRQPMRFVYACFLTMLGLCLSAAGLVPEPTSRTLTGGNLSYTNASRILFDTRSTGRAIEDSLQPLAEVLAEELEIVTGIKPAVLQHGGGNVPGPGDIWLQFATAPNPFPISEEEEVQSYTLSVSDRVVISSAFTKGVSYGTTTLTQSIVDDGGSFHIPRMEITDTPVAGYRALMIDLARNPSSIGTVREIVRLARQYKIRYLHLHLTDDQHFTFPFKPVTDNLQNNFVYNRQDLLDLTAYADARGVTIIPELDLPGHSTRLMQSNYLIRSGNHAAVAHPDNYGKIQAIIDDMLLVFPSSPYFHIGGDESSAGNALIPFIKAMNTHVRSKPVGQKKRLMVWEGFHGSPTADIPATGDDRVVVFSWESSYNTPWNLLNSGYQIINASWKPMYVCGSGATSRGPHVRQLMWPAETIHTWNKDTFMHWEPGRPVFNDAGPNDPVIGDGTWDANLIGKQDQVIGGQMLSWEQNERTIVRDLIVRLPVMADRLWNPNFSENYAAFDARAQAIKDRALSIVQPVEILPYGPSPEPPYAADYRYYEGSNTQITLRNRTKIPGTIRYSTAGSSHNAMDYLNFDLVPATTTSSTAYAGPFTSPNGGFGIRAQLYRTNGTAVEGHDWQHYNNWENKISLTEFQVPRIPIGSVPDFASYTSGKVKHRFMIPLLRGPYVLDEVKGQMFRADIQAPGTGNYTLRLQVSDGAVSVYVDLNRNGIWETSEKVLADVSGDNFVDATINLGSGTYPLRVDHASGAVGAMVWLRMSGQGTGGYKEIANYLVAPSGMDSAPAVPQRVTPAEGATGVRTTASLSWTSDRADSYEVYLWPRTSSKPVQPTASGLTENSYSLASLQPGTEYRWTVVARNANGTAQSTQGSFTTFSAGSQKSIGWHYDGMGEDTMNSSHEAGVDPFSQANWNNHVGSGQGPGALPFDLKDRDGNKTTAKVTGWSQTSNNSWHHGYSNPTPNERLMGSFADQRPSITFSYLPEDYVTDGYSVIVYYGNNEGPNTSILKIVGSVDDDVSRTIITGNTAGAGYRAVGFVEETGLATGPTNYTMFTGLDDPEFTVSLVNQNNNGISAIQIIKNDPPPPPPPSAGSIGWNYDGVGDDTLSPSDVAGVGSFAQSNWNNHAGNYQSPGVVPFALKNQDGVSTTVQVTGWSQGTNNSWSHGYTSPTPNEKLMESFNDREPVITFSGIPLPFRTSGYSVVVYYGNNEGPSTSVLRVQGSVDDDVSRTIITGNTTGAGYRAKGFVEETGAASGPTNYTIFTDLNDPGFTVSLTGANNNGISAIQIVANPAIGFAYWQTTTAGAGVDIDSDHDKDGWVDLAEYALGGDPSNGLPPAGRPLVSAADNLSLTYSRPLTVNDVTYQLEGSLDCVNWHPINDITPVASDDGETETVIYTNLRETQDVPGINTSKNSFFRLSFSLR